MMFGRLFEIGQIFYMSIIPINTEQIYLIALPFCSSAQPCIPQFPFCGTLAGWNSAQVQGKLIRSHSRGIVRSLKALDRPSAHRLFWVLTPSRKLLTVKRKNMLDETAIESRLAKLEQEVAALKQKSADESTPTNWINRLIGSISDDEAFLEALKYGREFRDTDKPVDEQNKIE
jgi:hypothetical protein